MNHRNVMARSARMLNPAIETPIQVVEMAIQQHQSLNRPKLPEEGHLPLKKKDTCRSSGLDVGSAEIVALEQQPRLKMPGCRVGEAIAEIEDAWAAAAEAVTLGRSHGPRRDLDVGRDRRHHRQLTENRDQFESTVAAHPVETRNGRGSLPECNG
ncbi:hypothetical protein [Bosea sp. OK403]|uniref:hypothetical protein n=1 Tax=Bosea sp. OK403 TaxID=1855286 RepID=UPI001FCD143E|nr:hypothetical protein [Bosea sp. OK403]